MILFINTADQNEVTLALVLNGNIVIKKTFLAKYRQAELLLPEIKKLFLNSQSGQKALRGIVVVSGPGPFSALRIGISTANALAYALNLPIVGVKLSEISKESNLGIFVSNIFKKAKREFIVKPFYGAEPNITSKKR